MEGEDEVRETEAMRDWRLRGALWVSRLSAEEADMLKSKRKEQECYTQLEAEEERKFARSEGGRGEKGRRGAD